MPHRDTKEAYEDVVSSLTSRLDRDAAFKEAIGGNFLAVGMLEYCLLRSLGLQDGQLVLDVGCGSGRLSVQLASFPGIRYLGTDVVPRLLDYAREICRRPDWQFLETAGTKIPVGDELADFACFFSVFTHLSHEETYRYFLEAHRCLKLGGLLVFSFLEFRILCHWNTFIGSVENGTPGNHLNQFMDRDAIRVWAEHSGFAIRSIHDGDQPHIPIPQDVVWDHGMRMSGLGNFGQSVAVLEKVA